MIEILPYCESWTAEFQSIAARLRIGLGPEAIRIDHIGSTAVVGLAAKDIIDIQVTVAELRSELLDTFALMGYVHRPMVTRDHRPADDCSPDVEWQKWFFRPPAEQRPTNLHVRVVGNANQRYPLLFRDYLRANPATVAAYAELKRRLACELRDENSYPDVKDPAVDLIYFAAKAWASTSHWLMGASDA